MGSSEGSMSRDSVTYVVNNAQMVIQLGSSALYWLLRSFSCIMWSSGILLMR